MSVSQDSKKHIFRRVKTLVKFSKYLEIEILLKPHISNELQFIYNFKEDIRVHRERTKPWTL